MGYLWQATFKIHDSLEIAVFVFYSISGLVRKGAVVCPDFYLNDGHISIYCEEKPLIWLNHGKKTFLFEGKKKHWVKVNVAENRDYLELMQTLRN